MNDIIQTVWETSDARVCLVADYDAENPRQWAGLGVMAAKGHRRYSLGDSGPLVDAVDHAMQTIGPRLTARWLRIFHGATVVLPLGLIDHSGISMYVGAGSHPHDVGGWDSGLVGLIFDTPKTREYCGTPLERVEEALRDEVKVYDDYLRGNVYGAVYETRETWTASDGTTTRQTWEHEDSIFGLIGDDADEQALEYFPKPESAEKVNA